MRTPQQFREDMGYKYPPTLKKVCFDATGLPVGTRLEEVVAQATPFIFDFTYPLFDETHRQSLEQKIIKRYFYREISCVDVEEWKFRLDAKMSEIMPYYNKMYESIGLLTDILDDVDYTRQYDENTANTGNENTTSTQENSAKNQSSGTRNAHNADESENFTLNAASDTPQGQLTGLLDNTYLSAATKVDQNSSSSSDSNEARSSQSLGESTTNGTFDTSSNRSGTRDYVEKVKGKMYPGSKAKVVMEYRKAIMNIDAEIIGRLSDLFMTLYHPYYDAEEGDD